MLTEFAARCLMKFKAGKHFLWSLRGLLPAYNAKLFWFEPIRLVQNTLNISVFSKSEIEVTLLATYLHK